MIPSALVGVLSGYFLRGRILYVVGSYVVAGAVPWFGLLTVFLYDIYWRHSGHAQAASMWPIAQILGGTLAAITGVVACAFVKLVRKLISLDTPTKPQWLFLWAASPKSANISTGQLRIFDIFRTRKPFRPVDDVSEKAGNTHQDAIHDDHQCQNAPVHSFCQLWVTLAIACCTC